MKTVKIKDVAKVAGAGDAFRGAILYKLQTINKPLEAILNEELVSIVSYANKIASISITRHGAIDSYIFV